MREAEALHAIQERTRKADPVLWLIPLVLSGIGILMVTSTTSPKSFDASGTPFTEGIKQLKWLGIGLIVMLAAYCVPIRAWYRRSGFLWALSMILLIATLVPGVGALVGGARRWFRIGPISVQPSEILTLAMVMAVAKLTVKNEMNPEKCFGQIMFLFIVSALPLMKQPDLGSTILVLVICMGMYVERFGWKLPLLSGAFGVGLISVFIMIKPYRMRRVYAFLNPWLDPLDTGFQTIQGLIAFANGGTWGTGLGHGFQKLQYLPAASTDFIYAALGEEMGLIGTLGVIALCVLWLARCRALYNRAPEGYETALIWGLSLTIAVPLFINIAGVTNAMPLTGMPLPFVSYGGSALVMMWMKVGILLRIHKECAVSA
jgi:cell division protein FtsW